MKKLENYGVEEMTESELSQVNGGLNLGAVLNVLNGIVTIVTEYMQAALGAVEDFVRDFLGGIRG